MSNEIGAFALLCFTSLLAIINPLSAAPMYLALTAGYSPRQRRRTLRNGIFTAFVVLVVFALLGGAIFQLFGITLDAFRIAGGIIFFGIGMDMLQAKRSRGKTTEEEEAEGFTRTEVGVTPLGIPMITGPGAITTVMVLMTRADTHLQQGLVFGSVVMVMLISWLVLSASPRLVRALGQTGLNVMTRIMGLLVTVIAIQFIVDGTRPILTSIIRAATRS
ncbi:MAG: multiple antibiotic resistance (MarC)-related protein [Gemmatimonadetes bacterium]|nr:multiple antibiotic resistance (MarC)-related protein [Gemmatimonadota bacterium]